MEIKAGARFCRTAPDKIRILTSLIKGKTIEQAINQLTFSGRAASRPLILVLKQAKDQAKEKNVAIDKLIVKTMMVDEGSKLKRRRIRQQGRATAILKRGSHITIILTDNGNSKNEILNSKQEKMKNKSNLEIRNSDLGIKATEGSV